MMQLINESKWMDCMIPWTKPYSACDPTWMAKNKRKNDNKNIMKKNKPREEADITGACGT